MYCLTTPGRLLASVLLVLLLNGAVPAAVIHVNAEGTGDYPAIQVAIVYAAEGDTILASPGVYTGYFDRNLELRGKAITLMSSAGPESTVIDCQMDGRGFYIHEGEGPGTIIQGFTVTNGLATCGGGMHCQGASPTVVDMVISRCEATDTNSCGGGGAVYCNGGGSPAFDSLVIFDNAALKGGALLTGGSAPALSGCSIVGNVTANGGSVQCVGGSITIENTIVAYDRTGAGITCGGSGTIDATHCLTFGNLGGSEICGDDIENLSEDPLFCDWEAEDLEVCSDSPCLPSNNPYGVHIGARGESDCPCHEHIVVAVPYDYGTIAEALEVVAYGDTVIVHPGVYYEDSLSVGLGVALVGVAGRDSTFIDASGGGPGILIGYGSDSERSSDTGRATDETRIEGFTVTGASDSAIKINVASPSVSSCRIVGNTAASGGGIYCDRGSPILTDVLFLENEATQDANGSGGGGFHCRDGSPALTGCVFWGNTAVRGGAVYCYNYGSAPSPTIVNCTLSDNAGTVAGSGVYCRYSSPTIEHTVLAHGTVGSAVACSGVSEPEITQCVVYWNDNDDDMCGTTVANMYQPPLFCDHVSGDLTVCEESPCLPENNIYGVQIGALGLGECACPGGSTLSVPFDYTTIGEALAAAETRDTILVYPGTYPEHGLPLEWGISLIGVGGPDSTVIDAEGGETVLSVEGHGDLRAEGHGTVVRGVTITGATGSAIRVANTTLDVADCIVAGNSGASGGAMFVVYGGVALEGCEFSDNAALWNGGGLYAFGSLIEVADCRFVDNRADGSSGSRGGAFMGDASEVSFRSSDFIRNIAASGGAIHCENGEGTTIEHCSFVGNQATDADPFAGGGGVHCHSDTLAIISGSTFYMNSADRGGGVHVRGQASATMTGCTFVGNDAAYGSSAFIRSSTMDIENTILAYGSGGGALYCAQEAPTTTRFCDVYANAGGDTLCGEQLSNLFVDPAFCDTTGGVFYLQECSPCVGSGVGGTNIGAWEVACPCEDPTGTEQSHRGLTLLSLAPNPSSGGVSIRYRVPDERAVSELAIYDVRGRRVNVLVDSARGTRERFVTWDGRDVTEHRVAAGVYFYEIRACGEKVRGRLVIIR